MEIYTRQDNLDKIHNVAWGVALALSLLVALASTLGAVLRFLGHPTHVVQQDTPLTMGFPSVLVCPEVHFEHDKMDQFMRNIKIPQNVNATLVRSILRQLAAFTSPVAPYSLPQLELLEAVLAHNDLTAETAILMLTSTCEEMLVRCSLFKKITNCSEMFTKMLTNYGYCCVFNGRSIRRDLDRDGNHAEDPDPQLETQTTGFMNSLMVAVRQPQQPMSVKFAYKLLSIQGPQQYVEASLNGTPLLPRTEHWAGYLPHRMQIGAEAVKLGDGILGCRMNHERLRYFPVYKKIYCLSECATARVWARCGCVGLAQVGPPGAAPCRARSLQCLRGAAVAYNTPECDCPSACDQTMAQVLMQTSILVQGTPIADHFYQGLDLSRVSVLRAFVLHRNTRVRRRRSYYDATNLFSQLGGMFSVYCGCSTLTLLELVLLGRRWWAGWRRGGRHGDGRRPHAKRLRFAKTIEKGSKHAKA